MVKANGRAESRTWQGQIFSYGLYVICGVILMILPPFVSAYVQSMLTKVLIFGIFALSLNLLMGYTGLMSLGHAAYFGAAGYTAGILIVRYGVESFWLVAPAGILMATLIAAFFGIIALRVSQAYFVLVTLALGELLYSVALKWRAVTGGSNGLVGIPYPDLGLPWFSLNTIYFYYFVFIIFIICCLVLYRIIKSPFGHALEGIRENEPRMRYLGYNVWLFKYIAFIAAGFLAGVAGVLFGYYSGVLAPLYLGILTSVYVTVMVLIGKSPCGFWADYWGCTDSIIRVYCEYIHP